MSQISKPVYLKNSEILTSAEGKITNFLLVKHVTKVVGDTIKCIQLDRDLWRIYLTTKEGRDKLQLQGIDIGDQHVRIYDSNPYSTGLEAPDDKSLKITICGVPLSVDDSAVLEMLSKLKVKPKTEMYYEKIRNPETKKMTSVLNGNRFLYVEPIPPQTSLPRNVYCAGLKCKLFHQDQHVEKHVPTCTNCWQSGHNKFNCDNESRCAVCKETGHKPGCDECEFYISEKPKNLETFQGEKNPLSNFFPCELSIFGETFKSAEQAFQTTKALRSGDVVAAERIRNAKTALEAKRIGNLIQKSEQWKETEKEVMEEIVAAKVKQCEDMRETLSSYKPSVIFGHPVYDMYWGTALSYEETIKTSPRAWPGKNIMGEIIARAAKNLRKKRKPSSDNVKR